MEGTLSIQLVELLGLILPDEINRSKQDRSKLIEPSVNVILESMNGNKVFEKNCEPQQKGRFSSWSGVEELVVIGKVNHSGQLISREIALKRQGRGLIQS